MTLYEKLDVVWYPVTDRQRANRTFGSDEMGWQQYAVGEGSPDIAILRAQPGQLLLEGCGHWWPVERPQEAAVALERFWVAQKARLRATSAAENIESPVEHEREGAGITPDLFAFGLPVETRMRGARPTWGIANAVRTCHRRPMPDYSLFGDEHVRQYEATGGKVGHDWNGTHCLILHTTGRKSGETRKFPLIYGRDGDNYLVVASKGGAPEHPGWYRNLLAHPDVKIQVWDKVIPVSARPATAQEKARLWPIMTAQWPGYDEYQAGTKRDIPLVLLSPR